MIRSKIAELMVGFSAGGSEKKLLSTIKSMVGQVTSAATKVAAVGGGFLAGFVGSALRGAVEGSQLSQAFQMLARSIGDAFAPAIRQATTLIMGAAMWVRNLSPELKAQVATWILVGTAIATGVALLPALGGAVTAITGLVGTGLSAAAAVAGLALSLAFGLVTASVTVATGAVALFKGMLWLATLAAAALQMPFLVVPLLIGAAVAAAVLLFRYFSSGSKQAAERMTENNKSWLDYLIDGCQWIVVKLSEIYNAAVKAVNFVSDADWDPIDVDKLKEGFEKFRSSELLSRVKNIGSKVGEALGEAVGGEMPSALGGLGAHLKDLVSFDMKKNPKLHQKVDVQFEDMQGTFDRLQKAFAEGDALGIDQQQLDAAKEMSGKIDRLIDAVKDTGRNFGIIG